MRYRVKRAKRRDDETIGNVPLYWSRLEVGARWTTQALLCDAVAEEARKLVDQHLDDPTKLSAK